MVKFFFSVALAFVISFSLEARAGALQANLFRTNPSGGPGQELPWIEKGKWGWTRNKDGARLLKAAVYLRVPDAWRSRGEFVAESESLEISGKGAVVLLKAGAIRSKLVFREKSGNEIPLELAIKTSSADFYQEGCKQAEVAALAQGERPPFFLGVACTMDGKKVRFHLTFPEEAGTGQSTLFESKGKGESWRIYDLGEITAARGEIGRVQLVYEDKTYQFIIASLKSKSSDKQNEDTKKSKPFSISLGYASLTLSGSGVGSGGAIYGGVRAEPDPTFSIFGIGAEVDTVSPMSEGTAYSLVNFAPFAFARVLGGPSFIWDIRAFFTYLSISQASTGIGVQSSQPGIGTSFLLRSGNMSYQLTYLSETAVYKKVVDESSKIHLRMAYKGSGRFDYGGGAMSQAVKATSATGASYSYATTAGYFTLGF